jgi:hypothetical protein
MDQQPFIPKKEVKLSTGTSLIRPHLNKNIDRQS